MSHDEQAARVLREALGAGLPISEKKMFGGLGFMLDGNMLCGVLSASMGGGAMFRVGKEREAEALAIDGVERFAGTGRPMGGFVAAPLEVIEDQDRLDRLLGMALAYAGTLPPKG